MMDFSSFTSLADPMEGPSTSHGEREAKVNLINPERAAALFGTNTSDRRVTCILSAMTSV